MNAEAALREEVDLLREKVRQLEEQRAPTTIIPLDWGLSLSETIIASMLFTRELVSEEAIISALYDHREDDLPDNLRLTVAQFLYKIRQKLKNFGITLHNRRGQGWYVDVRDRANLRR